uniref:Uncharacterized protein n=1 Tax=Anguilla anguilla TaxID=7936 RepID=A0A0E9PYD1_ANGAN
MKLQGSYRFPLGTPKPPFRFQHSHMIHSAQLLQTPVKSPDDYYRNFISRFNIFTTIPEH